MINFLFPTDPTNAITNNKFVCDDHFLRECKWAEEQGYSVHFYNVDAPAFDEPMLKMKKAETLTPIILRGWMFSTEYYTLLAKELKNKNYELIVSPEQYQKAHYLPNWYNIFEEHTPTTTWQEGTKPEHFHEMNVSALQTAKAYIKDYVKSAKDAPDASVVNNVHVPEELLKTITNFYEYTGIINKGIVVREYENFPSNLEWRTWWVNGKMVLITEHPNHAGQKPEKSPPDCTIYESLVKQLNHPFITLDLTLREDGTWRIIEIGDGQVSDLPETEPEENLLQHLVQIETR